MYFAYCLPFGFEKKDKREGEGEIKKKHLRLNRLHSVWQLQKFLEAVATDKLKMA